MPIDESIKSTNPPEFKNSGDLQQIVDFFGSDNLVFGGDLADFYWLNRPEINRFEIEIQENNLLNCFKIEKIQSKILQNSFGLYLLNSSLYVNSYPFCKFYHGLFNKSKLDLFVKNNPVIGEKVDGSKFNLCGTVQIQSPIARIADLNHLKWIPEHYKFPWMKNSNHMAEETIALYKKAFPEIFKIKRAIRR
jgi:hypothetical protein